MSSRGPMEDRLAIRERMDAYADAVFRHDAQAWADCWTEDAVWALPGAEVRGRETMVKAWTGAMANYALAGFFVFPGEVVVEGETAQARSYTQEVLHQTDGKVRRIIGRYDDRLQKTADGWRFAERRYTVLNDDQTP